MSFFHRHEQQLERTAWETEQVEGETGEVSGADLEAVVTVVTAEGVEEVTATSLSIPRSIRLSKTHRTRFPPR